MQEFSYQQYAEQVCKAHRVSKLSIIQGFQDFRCTPCIRMQAAAPAAPSEETDAEEASFHTSGKQGMKE